MRSKTPLALMEQAVMVLVFALAAVLCLRVFVWSDMTSETGAAKDMAAVKAQSVAEVIKNEGKTGGGEEEVLAAAAKALGGKYDGAAVSLEIGYLDDWQVTSEDGRTYCLSAAPADLGTDMLGAVHITVDECSSGEILFEIDAAWQKEAD